ncbi:helix-turn-helix transcriptional regulator [Rathayibacter sp. VKM Ac-2856]|uniref:helix-turn-helix transcriptional regulator n=1 Tax=unclassified Rathayibacter TaxID=2609250 RepID=UPI001566372A|nr:MULTISPECIES: helix-turn-helix transcriptional regulator [unclassified Rathayibacter]NQX05603.1 helix-turn-helix transcriptional regulator [Rathayibacter sp. VKM Ac-2858]NQX20522.1 helix-turn-helix transcriptional regulator [Rathayibacter sp. VKM Ac-2856]
MDEDSARGTWRREPSTVVVADTGAPTRIEEPFAIAAGSVLLEAPHEFAPHRHELHELVWVRGGTMTVRLEHRILTVPDGFGVWIPAGTEHAGRTTARTALCDALFDPERSPVPIAVPALVEVTPVLAALLTRLSRTDLEEAARLRAEAVVFDVIAPSSEQYSVTVPQGERLAPLVAALLDDPTDRRTLADWAEHLGVGERTLSRVLRAQTGLSFLQWRQALRAHRAVALLAEGRSVQDVSELMGHTHPSTFIAAFKRVMGTTPGAFAQDQRGAAGASAS